MVNFDFVKIKLLDSWLFFESSNSPSLFYAAKLNEKIETYYNDIRDFEKFEECVFKFKPDIVIHCAAQSLVSVGYTNPIETYSTNIGNNKFVRNFKKLIWNVYL